VVNNGSSDGTKEFLDNEDGLLTIHQANLGGAGGFYAGMKYMMDNGYDWLWMMDDDGIAEAHQLEELMKYASERDYPVVNALVLNRDRKDELSFHAPVRFQKELDGQELTNAFVHPFNGTLIHRSVIEKVGMIKKEMFIWGDEMEYMERLRVNGYKPATIVKAIHYHPKEKGKKMRVIPFIDKYQIMDKPAKFSKYYYRNTGFMHREYGHHWYTGTPFVCNNLIAQLIRGRFGEASKFIKYYLKGRRNDFTD
jgi:rhamnopyranosyl-N-acetylglucosaminyl-diphospho-decaprenol beta-1,3/1,4-galactofuranosyltransferase